jgi:hypothetical protein
MYRILVWKPGGKRTLGRPRRKWGIILKWIFRSRDVGVWTGLNCLRVGTGEDTYEGGNEPSGSIKCGELSLDNWPHCTNCNPYTSTTQILLE